MDPSQANPTWQVVAFLPTARGDMGAWAYDTGTGYEISGKIAVAGGPYATPDAQGYIYTPGTNTWATFPNLMHATRNYGTAQLNGILYAPDYVINAGGIISVSREYHGGATEEQVIADIQGIPARLTQIFERARHENRTTNAVADQMARELLSGRRHKRVA